MSKPTTKTRNRTQSRWTRVIIGKGIIRTMSADMADVRLTLTVRTGYSHAAPAYKSNPTLREWVQANGRDIRQDTIQMIEDAMRRGLAFGASWPAGRAWFSVERETAPMLGIPFVVGEIDGDTERKRCPKCETHIECDLTSNGAEYAAHYQTCMGQ